TGCHRLQPVVSDPLVFLSARFSALFGPGFSHRIAGTFSCLSCSLFRALRDLNLVLNLLFRAFALLRFCAMYFGGLVLVAARPR
ncbi:hypothetical protein LLG95_04635, partial [bacterium]|nr:hypothetical protein [bacterium]